MTIYIIVLFLLVLFTVNRVSSIYAILILLLLAALRSTETGIDLLSYIDYFTGVREMEISKMQREFGYSLYSEFLRLIDTSPRWYIIATSITILLPLYFFVKKSSSNINLSILLFYLLDIGYVFTLSGIRQSIALALFLVALFLFIEKNKLYASVVILIAASFHNTVVFIIPIIFISYYNWNRYFYILVLIFSALIGLSGILSLGDIFNKVFINYGLFNEYSYYVDYAQDQSANLLGRAMVIIPSSILVLVLVKNGITDIYFKLFFYGVVLTNFGAAIPMIFRYFSYLTILEIILIPKMQFLNSKTKLISYIFITYLIAHFLLIELYRNNNLNIFNNYVPYKFLN